MQKRSRAAQIKKYGGKVGYLKEMKRRSALGNTAMKKFWNKKKLDKAE